ncbi:GntR family transcriptional regulator [Sphingomonas sp. KR1UV-12]|uniref:GntR family transcriptional regulator n=1 Tax=Sphingomonas aurea TaxID=3063994 RepID=A0ABT9ELY7_9SPHN|nr:GntR family transcriptional regulator [Sphingomonas sp. KR1UV-12]MDP1027653.1 GntR family transcriptional regulator [Sphingomonas sp. KR1UV-12]
MSFSQQIGAFRHDNPAPLYVQLQQLLRDAIQKQVLAPSEAIPPERDLAAEYDVSRITVRKAIAGLVEEGLLTRRRGAGTFVATRVEKVFSRLSSFSEDMLSRGRTPSSQWISRTSGSVTPEEAMALGLSPGAPVWRFQRIRFADEIPMALEFSTIEGRCLEGIDAVDDSLYAALDQLGNRPVRALQRLRAVPFSGEHARMLGVDTGHAGLLIERRGFLRDGRVVEFTQSFYRGDAYDFVAELSDP